MHSARDVTHPDGEPGRPGASRTAPFVRGPFTGLGEVDLRELGRLGTRRVYAPGEALMIEGDPGDRAALLLTGCVKVVAATEDGGEALLAVRLPGELLGELAVLDGEPRSASVLAVRTSTTREIGGPAFLDFLADRPAAALAVQRSVTRKLRSATRHRVDAGHGTGLARLARTLHTLLGSYGTPVEDGLRIDVPLSHADLAALARLSPASVERSLRTLRDQGAVRTSYRELVVLDRSLLARAAGVPLPPEGGGRS
ncbi:Crp/Fnr family transcriptional regulator [Kitasatospora sp. NPDC056184]|uniref:Crp/Fnr family transcriptional regulator n=1 Tax=Kitasatospora sp. NPDC056184 TaxID=3345738 RepID=UPI0035DEC4AA